MCVCQCKVNISVNQFGKFHEDWVFDFVIMVNQQERRRQIVCNFYNTHPLWPKSKVVEHFVQMGESRSTIYNILASFGLKKTTARKPGSGNYSSLSKSSERARLKKITAGRVAKSYRELGRKFKCDGKTVKKYLKDMGIDKRCRKVKPTVSENQEITQKVRLRKLVKEIFYAKNNVTCVMDDESYFTLDGNEWQGNYYFENTNGPTDENVKYIEHTKFPKKVLLWLAISRRGMSKPVFFESGLAVNADRYIERCLPLVRDFINTSHRG